MGTVTASPKSGKIAFRPEVSTRTATVTGTVIDRDMEEALSLAPWNDPAERLDAIVDLRDSRRDWIVWNGEHLLRAQPVARLQTRAEADAEAEGYADCTWVLPDGIDPVSAAEWEADQHDIDAAAAHAEESRWLGLCCAGIAGRC